MKGRTTGVILMSYGSATTAEHVNEYFEHIYKGKAPESLISKFRNRYQLVGRSPLIEITEAQAAALENVLGKDYVVRAGMRHSKPFIEDAIGECGRLGVTSLLGIILSPQFSPFIMEGYKEEFLAGAHKHDIKQTVIALPWPAEPHFIELLAKRISDKLAIFGDVPVIFTTHSLPQSVVEKDLSYLAQLKETINAIRARLTKNIKWYHGYQSAGHTPEKWLKPDLTDILAKLKEKGHTKVLIVPIQFLADHLEILYDLDIETKKQCDEFGIHYYRIEMPNTDPLFIAALASIVRRELSSKETQAPSVQGVEPGIRPN